VLAWNGLRSVVLSLALLASGPLRPEDRATGGPYVTFLAKRLPAGKQDRCATPASHHLGRAAKRKYRITK
jgi:hypothetical protein